MTEKLTLCSFCLHRIFFVRLFNSFGEFSAVGIFWAAGPFFPTGAGILPKTQLPPSTLNLSCLNFSNEL